MKNLMVLIVSQHLHIKIVNELKTIAHFSAQGINNFFNGWYCSSQVVNPSFSDQRLATCSYTLCCKLADTKLLFLCIIWNMPYQISLSLPLSLSRYKFFHYMFIHQLSYLWFNCHDWSTSLLLLKYIASVIVKNTIQFSLHCSDGAIFIFSGKNALFQLSI